MGDAIESNSRNRLKVAPTIKLSSLSTPTSPVTPIDSVPRSPKVAQSSIVLVTRITSVSVDKRSELLPWGVFPSVHHDLGASGYIVPLPYSPLPVHLLYSQNGMGAQNPILDLVTVLRRVLSDSDLQDGPCKRSVSTANSPEKVFVFCGNQGSNHTSKAIACRTLHWQLLVARSDKPANCDSLSASAHKPLRSLYDHASTSRFLWLRSLRIFSEVEEWYLRVGRGFVHPKLPLWFASLLPYPHRNAFLHIHCYDLCLAGDACSEYPSNFTGANREVRWRSQTGFLHRKTEE